MGICSTKTSSSPSNNSIENKQTRIDHNNNNNNNNKIMNTTNASSNNRNDDDDGGCDKVIQEFELKKYHPGCTGMFWRSDPTGQTKLASNNDWPRDGAKLRGYVIEHKGSKWLLATHVLQNNDKEWKSAPSGAAMPFEYNHHYYLE